MVGSYKFLYFHLNYISIVICNISFVNMFLSLFMDAGERLYFVLQFNPKGNPPALLEDSRSLTVPGTYD